MRLKNTLPIVILLIIATPGALALYTIHTMAIDDLIICATHEESDYIPLGVCRYYLINHRINQRDIHYLENQAGLGFLLNIPDKNTRNRLIGLFIDRGIDINLPSAIDGLPPIQAAILLNDPSLVRLLLDRNASIGRKNTLNGLNAMEFLDFIQAKTPSTDRTAVAAILQTRHPTR